MINLLPKEEKRAFRNKYRVRVATVALLFLFALQLIIIVLHAPTFYSMFQLKQSLAAELETRKLNIPKDVEGIQNQVAALKESLEILKGKGELLPLTLVGQVSSSKIPGIYLLSYSYDAQSKSVQIRGTSDTRDHLTSFRKLLRELGPYQSVDFPPSTLLKERDIEFNMKMVLK